MVSGDNFHRSCKYLDVIRCDNLSAISLRASPRTRSDWWREASALRRKLFPQMIMRINDEQDKVNYAVSEKGLGFDDVDKGGKGDTVTRFTGLCPVLGCPRL